LKRPTEIDFLSTVDWEHPKTPAEGVNFVHHLHATRAALPSPMHQLSTALPIGQYCLKNINISDVAQELDLLNLMGYDFAGPWTEISDHHAQLFTPYGDGSPSLENLVPMRPNMSYHGVSQPTSWSSASLRMLGSSKARRGQDSHSMGVARSITRPFPQSGLRKHKLITR